MCSTADRKNIDKLVAKIAAGHVASEKVVVKNGGVRGEVLENVHGKHGKTGEKTDVVCWYIYRPAIEQGNFGQR